MSWLLALAGFSALIILHELGHFTAAKLVGMRVERFMLFFAPIFKIRRGETEYGIGWIPAGGYVKITGMNPAEEIPPEVAHRAYYRQPVWKRIVVIAAGPLVNIVIAFLIFLAVFVLQGKVVGTTTQVDALSSDSAAVGVLRAGDRLLAVDGVRGTPDRLRAQIGTHHCAGVQREGCRAATPARVTFSRDGHVRTAAITPRYAASERRVLVGFSFGLRYQREGLVEGAGSSVTGMWRVTTATAQAIARVFYSAKARKQVSGVVGSFETTRQTIKQSGFVRTMQLLALISLSLAVVNLFPFLPLDGGHIFFAIAEKLRGRAIPFSVMERASAVGILLVIFLFAVGVTNDIGHIRDQGFQPLR